jgi:hypothetical protein
MKPKPRTLLLLVAILAFFSAGYAAGLNHFGMPKTIVHVVIIQWKPTTTAAQRQAVINGVRNMAEHIPGILNIWLKPVRVASLTWNYAFVIEFANQAAANRYATAPIHRAWSKLEQAARLDSLNVQVSN